MTAPIRSMAELVDKEAARAAGLLLYATGKPCKYGHCAPRYVSTGICHECSTMHKRLAWKRDPEGMRAKGRARIAANPQANRDRVKVWRKANPEKKRAAAKRHYERKRDAKAEYRRKNRERLKAYFSQHHQENKEKHRANRRNRKARLRAADGFHTAADIEAIFKMQRGRCAYCRIKLKDGWHVDHIIALAKGGSNWPSNLQVTCETCNTSKQHADPIVFAQRLGKLL